MASFVFLSVQRYISEGATYSKTASDIQSMDKTISFTKSQRPFHIKMRKNFPFPIYRQTENYFFILINIRILKFVFKTENVMKTSEDQNIRNKPLQNCSNPRLKKT